MKKASLLIYFISFFVLLVTVALLTPYIFYYQVTKRNYSSELYNIGAWNSKLLKSDLINYSEFSALKADDSWKNFHFYDFEIPLPVRHPLFLFVPIVKKGQLKLPHMGFKLINLEEKEFLRMDVLPVQPVHFEIGPQKLFALPIVKSVIKHKSDDEVWNDLFTKDLSKFNVPYEELVYNLHLLYLRKNLFGNNANRFGFILGHPKEQVAIVDYGKVKDGHLLLAILKHENKISSYFLKFQTDSNEALFLRNKFIAEVTSKKTNEESAHILYRDFKRLNYDSQIDQEGMLYLYTAWTHWPHNKEFVREMIQLLERGKNNFVHLGPLYDYAFDTYGSNFSLIKGNERESAHQHLNRKISEENASELERAKNIKVKDFDENSLSDAEREEYMLKRSKEEGMIQDKKTLIVE